MSSLFKLFLLLSTLSLAQLGAFAIPTTQLNEMPHVTGPPRRLTEWAQIGRIIARQSAPGGLRMHESKQRQVLMINGTADDAFITTCYPESGLNSSSYKFTFRSDNQRVINESTDVTWSHVFGTVVSNISVLVDFNRFPGKATLTIEARRIRDDSLYDSISVHYLAAGFVIYTTDTSEIVSGTERSLTIESYEEIYEKPHWDLAVFAQYLNGTDSTTGSGKSSSGSETFSTSDIKPFLHCSGQILWDHDFCSVTEGAWNGTSTVLKRGCGMGFSTESTSGDHNNGLHFALYFQKYRAGECVMVFEWARFTLNTFFDDEEYTNFLSVEILGQPPAVVRRIEPSNPFNEKGGEQLQVEMINTADVNVTSFNVHDAKFMLVKGSRHYITGPDDYYESARFLTEPGSGRNLPWTISGTRIPETNKSSEPVVFLDETDFLFSYDDDTLTLQGITPSSSIETGGTEIVLLGNFGSFSLDREHDNVLLGNVPIDIQYFVSVSSTEIKFRAPPRGEIGSERLLSVTVQVEHSFSNSLTFTYISEALILQGYAFGASFDLDKQSHVLSSCGNTTFMVTTENLDDSTASYKWNVFDKATFGNSTPSLLNETSISYLYDGINALELPNTIFEEYGVPYSVTAEVSIGNLSSSYKFIVQKSRNIVAGVTLVRPEDRYKASPDVNLRVLAKVEIPDCFKDPASLIYEWYYQENGTEMVEATSRDDEVSRNPDIPKEPQMQRLVFSFENTTGAPDHFLSPIRLGGELMIPRERLTYGLHAIQLTVRDHNQPRFYGKGVTSVTIFESALIARIGNGFASRTVSDSEQLHLSANASFDPDMNPLSTQSGEMTFNWKCAFSFIANFSDATTCGNDLLPTMTREEFTIPKAVLQQKTSVMQEAEGKLYIRYSLTVRKRSRIGEASQLLIVSKSNGENMSHGAKVDVLNSSGEQIDTGNVKFWEDIIIQPVAPGGTQWSFRLDSPYGESARFLAGKENIISTPGYYSTPGSSTPDFQRLPLGILADKLSPNQIYQFSIAFRQAGVLSEEVTVRLKTVELPRLFFPPLGYSSGTVDTVFRATAKTSFKANGTFDYQFYLMEVGNLDSEYCVDGCSGANVVIFKVGKPGHYTFQCRLLAADGKKVLVVMNNPKIIVISAPSSAVTFDEVAHLMWKDYYIGDDGAVNRRAFYVAETMYEQGTNVVSAPRDGKREICANITSLWSSMARGIVQRDLPNTARVRNYVRIAISCARLRCFEREDTLYDLLGLVDTAISRVPSEEALSTSSYEGRSDMPELGLEQDLIRFYNLSMSYALSAFAGGSSRDRLTASQGEVSNIILDLGEMWTKHVTATATSGQVCGWEATYTSKTSELIPGKIVIASRAMAPVGINTMKVAVRCTPEQGMSIKTPYASFAWCDAVYDLTGSERKLVTLAETLDFPYFSRIQGQNKTDSARLVSVEISTLGEGNRLVPALSESMVAAQAQETGDESHSCYRIGMKMKSGSDVRSEKGTYNIPYVMRPRKTTFGQTLTQPFEGGYYGRRTEGILVTPDTRNSSEFVLARSNALGLYGVEKANNRSALDKLNDTLEGTGFELVGILIGIVVLILIIALSVFVVLSFVLSMREPPPVEMAEGYVDRDFYGRRDVRLAIGTTDSTSVATTGDSANSTASGRDRNRGIDDEDMLGTSIRGDAGETPPR